MVENDGCCRCRCEEDAEEFDDGRDDEMGVMVSWPDEIIELSLPA